MLPSNSITDQDYPGVCKCDAAWSTTIATGDVEGSHREAWRDWDVALGHWRQPTEAFVTPTSNFSSQVRTLLLHEHYATPHACVSHVVEAMHEGRYGKELATLDSKTASATCYSARAAAGLRAISNSGAQYSLFTTFRTRNAVLRLRTIHKQHFLCLLHPLGFRDEWQCHMTSNARARGRISDGMTSGGLLNQGNAAICEPFWSMTNFLVPVSVA